MSGKQWRRAKAIAEGRNNNDDKPRTGSGRRWSAAALAERCKTPAQARARIRALTSQIGTQEAIKRQAEIMIAKYRKEERLLEEMADGPEPARAKKPRVNPPRVEEPATNSPSADPPRAEPPATP